MTPIMTNIVLDRQSDPAISSLANPNTATRLTDTDILDHSSSNDRENDSWPIESKMESLIALTDHELSMDEYMLETYSTDTDLDEPDPSEQQPDEQQQVSGEQEQEQQQQQQQQQEEEEHVVFKRPKKPSPKKFKKAPVRRQKSRACKSTSKSYNMDDFSDDAELD